MSDPLLEKLGLLDPLSANISGSFILVGRDQNEFLAGRVASISVGVLVGISGTCSKTSGVIIIPEGGGLRVLGYLREATGEAEWKIEYPNLGVSGFSVPSEFRIVKSS